MGELGGAQEGETAVRMYCMKKNHYFLFLFPFLPQDLSMESWFS